MAICPHCGREIPDDVAICPYCGAQVSPDVAVCGNCGKIIPANAKVCPYCGVELSDTVRCPKCGHEIPADSKSCPYCGYRFDKDHPMVKTSARPVGLVGVSGEKIPPSKPPKAPKEKSGFWKGFGVGFIVALLIGMAFVGYFYVLPLQDENKNLNLQIQDLQERLQKLQEKYDSLSFKYDSLVMNYTYLNQSYLEKVQEYNSLLAQYTELQGKYQNLTDFEDEKFIVLLFFTTDYGNNKYWLYLEIDPQVYLYYKQLPHLPGSSQYMEEFKNYVVTDEITEEIVDAVKSKLVSSSDEELADALLSLAQNKIIDGSNGAIYENQDHVPGTYYSIDDPAKYPVETLILRSGECLDDTILYLSLLKTANFKCGFLFIPPQGDLPAGHAMAIVNLTSGTPTHCNPSGAYCLKTEIQGIYYYPAEVTKYGRKVGESDLDLENMVTYPVLVN